LVLLGIRGNFEGALKRDRCIGQGHRIAERRKQEEEEEEISFCSDD